MYWSEEYDIVAYFKALFLQWKDWAKQSRYLVYLARFWPSTSRTHVTALSLFLSKLLIDILHELLDVFWPTTLPGRH